MSDQELAVIAPADVRLPTNIVSSFAIQTMTSVPAVPEASCEATPTRPDESRYTKAPLLKVCEAASGNDIVCGLFPETVLATSRARRVTFAMRYLLLLARASRSTCSS